MTPPPCHTSTSPARVRSHLGTALFGAAGPSHSGDAEVRWSILPRSARGGGGTQEGSLAPTLPQSVGLFWVSRGSQTFSRNKKKAAVAPASSLTSSRGGSRALRSRRGWDRASGEERGCCPGGTASRARGPHDPTLPAPQRPQPLTRRRPLPAQSAHGAGEHRRGRPEDGAAGRHRC